MVTRPLVSTASETALFFPFLCLVSFFVLTFLLSTLKPLFKDVIFYSFLNDLHDFPSPLWFKLQDHVGADVTAFVFGCIAVTRRIIFSFFFLSTCWICGDTAAQRVNDLRHECQTDFFFHPCPEISNHILLPNWRFLKKNHKSGRSKWNWMRMWNDFVQSSTRAKHPGVALVTGNRDHLPLGHFPLLSSAEISCSARAGETYS